jgi:predicted GNAT superfamily acetyltransferase
MLEIASARAEDLPGIISLQQKNHFETVDKPVQISQGFVTVKHSIDQLKKIAGNYSHIIAKQDGKIAGYTLVMLKEYGREISTLYPLFDMLDDLYVNGKPLIATNYFVMGQVCVDVEWRGLGVFEKLYSGLKQKMSKDFNCVVTEVNTRNGRSMAAHAKVGFKEIKRYPENGEEWSIIAWDWTSIP